MADAQEEERTQQFSTPPATLQCRTDKLMQESLSNRQRPERGGGEGCLLMDLPCTEMDEIFFFFLEINIFLLPPQFLPPPLPVLIQCLYWWWRQEQG